MGFDVTGRKPKNENGEYFRNNIWWWRPLWAYTCDACEDIMSDKDREAGYFNDGKKISATKCVKMSKVLQGLIDDGNCTIHAVEYESDRKQAELDNEKKNCGDKDYNWTASYPFGVKNVQDWAHFLKDSGGIQIY